MDREPTKVQLEYTLIMTLYLIKVNSETDFAAKSDTFLNFLDNLGELALKITILI